MNLSVSPRSAGKKEVKQVRYTMNIPAVLYGKEFSTEYLSVKEKEFSDILRKIPSGYLATTIFNLQNHEGKERKAIIKDIAYHPVTYAVKHLDFLIINQKRKIQVNVPIRCTGVNECLGIKSGGALRMVLNSVKVSCFPMDLPKHLSVDIRDLSLHQSKKLSDLIFPEAVMPVSNLNRICVSIAKR